VADFGLSRELLLRDYYRSDGSGMTPVPVRWLAPESLEASVFTTMSDVVCRQTGNISALGRHIVRLTFDPLSLR